MNLWHSTQQNVCFLNKEPCILRPTLTNMKPVELKYYPFVISIDNRTGNCNVLSPKTCVPKEIEDI